MVVFSRCVAFKFVFRLVRVRKFTYYLFAKCYGIDMLSITQNNIKILFDFPSKNVQAIVFNRYFRTWPESKPTDNVYMPPKLEDRLLTNLPHTPEVYPDGIELPLKHPRHNIDMRGPERIHNQLIYRHSGLIALRGGSLTGSHTDVIRARVNKYMDPERFFAVWRIDPPWKAVSKRSLNKRLGGGKAKVHHYETPVRAGRVIFEIAGIGEYGEISGILENLSKRMPFFCMPISQQIMDDLKEEDRQIAEKNYNPFDYRDLLRRNIGDSRRHVDRWEVVWGGRYF